MRKLVLFCSLQASLKDKSICKHFPWSPTAIRRKFVGWCNFLLKIPLYTVHRGNQILSRVNWFAAYASLLLGFAWACLKFSTLLTLKTITGKMQPLAYATNHYFSCLNSIIYTRTRNAGKCLLKQVVCASVMSFCKYSYLCCVH